MNYSFLALFAISALALSASAEQAFFKVGQDVIHTALQAGGSIEEITADGQLRVLLSRGDGVHNTHSAKVSQALVAKKEGCSSASLGCVGDLKVVRIAQERAMALRISGVMPDGNITIGRSVVNAEDVAFAQTNACTILNERRVCVGDNVQLNNEAKSRQLVGIFGSGELALYDETIFSGNTRQDYFVIVNSEIAK